MFYSLKVNTLLLRQMTGQSEQPRVQQQHIHPQNSHLAFIGKLFFKTELIRPIVSSYSSGATREVSALGNSD